MPFLSAQDHYARAFLDGEAQEHVRDFHEDPGCKLVHAVFGKNKLVGNIDADVNGSAGFVDQSHQIAKGGRSFDALTIAVKKTLNVSGIEEAIVRLFIEKV